MGGAREFLGKKKLRLILDEDDQCYQDLSHTFQT